MLISWNGVRSLWGATSGGRLQALRRALHHLGAAQPLGTRRSALGVQKAEQKIVDLRRRQEWVRRCERLEARLHLVEPDAAQLCQVRVGILRCSSSSGLAIRSDGVSSRRWRRCQ